VKVASKVKESVADYWNLDVFMEEEIKKVGINVGFENSDEEFNIHSKKN
jgi:hypothetical protein